MSNVHCLSPTLALRGTSAADSSSGLRRWRRVLGQFVAGWSWALAVAASVLLTAGPALADDSIAGCRFFKAGAPRLWAGDIAFIPGASFSLVMMHRGAGHPQPTYCLYSMKTVPFTITCEGKKPEPFSFAGATIDSQASDILIFRNAAWYKICFKPV